MTHDGHDTGGDPRWDRIQALFEEALGLPEGEREGFLADSGEDPSILDEVRSLLGGHEREGGLLDLVEAESGGGAESPDLEARVREGLEDRYRLIRELGRGGMSRVYLAWEQKHDRRVVLKVLTPAFAALHGTDRFQREVKLVAQLSHPNIISLIDSGVVDGLAYYVMPYVEGVTLRHRLTERSGELLPVEAATTILRDVAEALEYAHREGVVHRDLKPDNILLAGPHAYLFDFGIARSISAPGEEDRPVTREGSFLGTPRYAAPEQVWGLPSVDHRADIYAWGVLAHELLTGVVPTPPTGSEPHGEPSVRTVFRERRPDVPPGLVALVARCLEVQPTRRPPDARTLVLALGGEGLGPRESALSRRFGGMVRRRRGWVAAAALVAALGVAGVGYTLARERGAPAVEEARAGVAMPVAVAAFRNQTGDSALTVVGRFAGDWITQGLQRVDRLSVVPWPAALQASLAAEDGDGNPVRVLAELTGAGTVVHGSYYEIGGHLQFRAEIVEAGSGRILSAPDPVSVPLDSAENAIQLLRDRISASLAIASDSRLASIPGIALRPPTFDAYRSFNQGVDRYLQQSYRAASDAFLEAYQRDTTFTAALVYGATTLMNSGDPARADSIVRFLENRRGSLTESDHLRLTYLRAYLDGDAREALQALRRARELAPGSRASYNLALTAIALNRPGEALDALRSVDPDRGELKGWAQYWTQLAHAHHLLGDFRAEAEAAREMRRRHPERRVALVLEARALAAAGKTERLDELLAEGRSLPPDTYWSLGGAMVVAAEELRAHGFRGWEGYLSRARQWLQEQLALDPDYGAHRYWLASTDYDSRRWTEARVRFAALAEDNPSSTTYRGMAALAAAHAGDGETAREELADPFPYAPGEHAGYRARLAAIHGDANRTVALLNEAFQRGYGGYPWVHASGFDDFAPVSGDSRIRQLLAPGG